MQFQLNDILTTLERTPGILNALLRNMPDEQAKIREDDNHWSAYDVVGHLNHGEETDWVPRARMILEFGKSRPFEPFDRFAMFEKSKGKSLNELLDTFESLREGSLAEIRAMNITPDKLALEGIHPAFGPVTLEQLLATWVVHDLNHIGQIVRVLSKQSTEAVGPWKEFLSILSWKV